MTFVGASASPKSIASKPVTLTSAPVAGVPGPPGVPDVRASASMFSALLSLSFGGRLGPKSVAGDEVLGNPGLAGSGASEHLGPGHDLGDPRKQKRPEASEIAPIALAGPLYASKPTLPESSTNGAAPLMLPRHAAPASPANSATENPITPAEKLTAASSPDSPPGTALPSRPFSVTVYEKPPATPLEYDDYRMPMRPTPNDNGPGDSAVTSIQDDAPNGASFRKPTLVALVAAPRSIVDPAAEAPPHQTAQSPLLVADQISQQISAHLDQLRHLGRIEIQFDLHPPELGRVQLHLTLEDGRVNVHMLVPNDTVKRLMDVQLTPWRAKFADMGVSVGQFDVRRDGGSTNPQRTPERSLQPIQPVRRSPAPVQRIYASFGNADSSVDVMA